MRTSGTTRTGQRGRGGYQDEAQAAELMAYVSSRVSMPAQPLTSEPSWLCEAFDAAWAWLLGG